MSVYVINDIVETHCYVVKSNCSKEVNWQTGMCVEENFKDMLITYELTSYSMMW